MNNPLKVLAFDFGASSGRAILGTFDGNKLTTEEMHRFSNDPVEIHGSFYWDILRLFHEVKQGILKCMNNGHKDIASLAVDTWGVDFGLLDDKGQLMGNPYHYRDARTEDMMEEVYKIIPKADLYAKTGIELMQLNTIFQLFSMKYHGSPLLKEAKTLLLMPDLFNYFLSGEKVTEYSIASTSQLLDPQKRQWSPEIIGALGLPGKLFTDIVSSGTVIGSLSPDIMQELGAGKISVVATAGHDTQSAIASVPANDGDFVYISCGTWSLMGIESDKPMVNEKSYKLSFTNEGGVGDKITFHKNIMGLWLIQECKRQWEREGEHPSYAELETAARNTKPFVSYIDPDSDLFVAPGNMPERIREYCRKTNQPIPETKGEIVRCITQSLAMKYRLTVEHLEEITGKKLSVIHMVGGGIQDRLLCQSTANATGRQVVAGPVEATSIGNLLVQLMAAGEIKTLQELRQVVKNSFPTINYEPQESNLWEDNYEVFKKIIKGN